MMMKKQIFVYILILFSGLFSACTQNQEEENTPQNVILLIGDGMGVNQVFAGITANNGKLNLEKCQYIGFQKTQSADNYITDSAASGTALATGNKTNNRYVGVDTAGNVLTTILEYAEKMNLATGLVSTSAVTHATPASFIAHQKNRNDYDAIAADFIRTDVDVVIGGGRKYFSSREDGRNLIQELEENNYQIFNDIPKAGDEISSKFYAFTHDEHNPPVKKGRNDMLPKATKVAIDQLSKNENGFFLMVEGSQIDWGGHDNDTEYVVSEVLDFDAAVGQAIQFAENNANTLVIVTADHETGGFTVLNGNIEKGDVEGAFSTGGHTGVMVPVFAYGPGAQEFSGIYENTEIFNKIRSLLEL